MRLEASAAMILQLGGDLDLRERTGMDLLGGGDLDIGGMNTCRSTCVGQPVQCACSLELPCMCDK